MGVNVTGEKKMLREIENRLGKKAIQPLVDQALTKAAEVFVNELESQFQTFRDTGASIDEMTLSDPYDFNGARTIRVHWKGPKDRYRVIHLNEFGTVKNPNPAGKGAIARAMRNSEKAYRETIRRELSKIGR
jgi:hypothetical protein